MARGKLITLEGGEGTGKSTQARMLADTLRHHGCEVVVTREPGGAPLSEHLRDLILKQRPHSPLSEFLLFAAARTEHIAVTMKPALDQGQWVICDRYIDSTRVYQGTLAGIEQGLIKAVETHTVDPYFPDLTFILDLAPEIGLARARARGALNRYDAVDAHQHEKLRAGFLAIAAQEPDRCAVIDAAGRQDQIADVIHKVVEARLLSIVER